MIKNVGIAFSVAFLMALIGWQLLVTHQNRLIERTFLGFLYETKITPIEYELISSDHSVDIAASWKVMSDSSVDISKGILSEFVQADQIERDYFLNQKSVELVFSHSGSSSDLNYLIGSFGPMDRTYCSTQECLVSIVFRGRVIFVSITKF